jgi:hypothetical protein
MTNTSSSPVPGPESCTHCGSTDVVVVCGGYPFCGDHYNLHVPSCLDCLQDERDDAAFERYRDEEMWQR